MPYNRRYHSLVVVVGGSGGNADGLLGATRAGGGGSAGSTCQPLCSRYWRPPTLHTGRAPPEVPRLLATAAAAAVEQDVVCRFATWLHVHHTLPLLIMYYNVYFCTIYIFIIIAPWGPKIHRRLQHRRTESEQMGFQVALEYGNGLAKSNVSHSMEYLLVKHKPRTIIIVWLMNCCSSITVEQWLSIDHICLRC